MNQSLQKIFNDFIKEQGKTVVKKERTFKSYMADLLKDYPAERNISEQLSQLGILSKLASPATKSLGEGEIARYADELVKKFGVDKAKAIEVIRMWAVALGVDVPRRTLKLTGKKEEQNNIIIERNDNFNIDDYVKSLLEWADNHSIDSKILPRDKEKLLKLKKLNLEQCNLKAIPNSFRCLINLEKLTLHCCNLKSFPEALVYLKSLTYLEIVDGKEVEIKPYGFLLKRKRGNELHTIKIPKQIDNLENLKVLYLDWDGLVDLPESIGNLKKLTCLTINSSTIFKLPESIGNLKNLQYLQLNLESMQLLPESIGNLVNLEIFRLRDSSYELPHTIGELKNLKEFYIEGNTLKELPETISNLKNLYRLYVVANDLSKLPKSITKLKKLREFYYSDNPFDESLIDKLRSYLNKFKKRDYRIKAEIYCSYIEGGKT